MCNYIYLHISHLPATVVFSYALSTGYSSRSKPCHSAALVAPLVSSRPQSVYVPPGTFLSPDLGYGPVGKSFVH